MQNYKERWQDALKSSYFPKEFCSKQTILIVYLSKIIARTEDDSDYLHNLIRF